MHLSILIATVTLGFLFSSCAAHAEQQVQLKSASQTPNAESTKLLSLHERIKDCYSKGKLERALPLMRRYVRILEEQSPESESLAFAYYNLSELLTHLNRIDEAATYRMKADKLVPVCEKCASQGITGVKILGPRNKPDTKQKTPNKFVLGDVYTNTPAANGGLLKGDQILAVDDQSVDQWTLEEVSKALKGKPDTSVKVSILRNEQKHTFQIVRRPLKSLRNNLLKESYCPHADTESRYPDSKSTRILDLSIINHYSNPPDAEPPQP